MITIILVIAAIAYLLHLISGISHRLDMAILVQQSLAERLDEIERPRRQ